jgi:hypothetical protein
MGLLRENHIDFSSVAEAPMDTLAGPQGGTCGGLSMTGCANSFTVPVAVVTKAKFVSDHNDPGAL